MPRIKCQIWRYRYLLVFALLMILIASGAAIVRAKNSLSDPVPCGDGEESCRLSGDFDPLSLESASPGSWTVNGPGLPAFGALVYDPDFKKIEQEARTKLERGLDVRLALSPYRDNLEFQEYVQKFDYEAGWNRAYNGSSPYPETLTLIQLVDRADKDLREARDLYAYLAVYAPEERFRADSFYTGAPPAGYDQPLCGETDKEDPDPVDPDNTGLVLDPVIDWCNFPARLRQSVREAANLRLLFGQQFIVDAMGLHFSGVDFVGGENAVRQELAQLRAAKNQYELAEQGLEETLSRVVGSGCFVSDFFTQPEWSLLSRSIENQETAQHNNATRVSYMDIASPESVPQVHELAMQSFRQGSIDGYLKLIGMASLASGQPGVGCAVGERPDGQLAAELATNLIETRRKAAELEENRNIFGFDVSFTPARPYKSSVPTTCDQAGAGDRGLWDEAWCAAQYAKELQNDEVGNTRLFENTQLALRTEIENIRTKIDGQVGAKSGCYRTDFPDDQAWYTCVEQQSSLLNACLILVNNPNTQSNNLFDTCMSNSQIKNGAAKQSLLDLRSIYMGYLNIKTKSTSINQRISNSDDRNATVTDWLLAKGISETAARVSQASVAEVECLDGSDLTAKFACELLGSTNIVLQLVAGGLSTTADIKMEDAEHTKEVANLLLDQSELIIEAYAAYQQYLSKDSEFKSLLSGMETDLLEAQRARAYFLHSPANDPSFRMVRDSSRMVLAKQMEYATRMSYLAARRAEYEYAARLSASNFRISDIYRARTADDIMRYLSKLLGVTNNLAGSATYQTNAGDFKVSVAKHVLLLTDEALAKEGFNDPAAAQVERTRRFREWVVQNTIYDPKISSQPVLRFSFTTSLLEGGLFSQVIQEGYERYWLLKLSGIGEPKLSSNGMSLNLVTDQNGLSYRAVSLTQGGVVHLRSFAGCTFDYRLMSPAVLLGLEWASNQNPEVATAVWNGNVNNTHLYTENGFRTPTFLGRAVSSTGWQALVYSGAPEAGMLNMDLQKLTDVEIIFSTTYASREPGTPQLSECTRIDW